MIRNSIFISLDSLTVSLGGTGGTGGTPQELSRTGGTDRWDQCAQGCPRGSAIFHGGPTGPAHEYHQKSAKLAAVPPVPRSHPVSRLSCLGMQKRVPEILELRRRLVEDLIVPGQDSAPSGTEHRLPCMHAELAWETYPCPSVAGRAFSPSKCGGVPYERRKADERGGPPSSGAKSTSRAAMWHHSAFKRQNGCWRF